MGEKPKMRVIFAKSPLFSKIQILYHKLLVRQTSNHQHCGWYAQNIYAETLKWFWAVLPGQNQLCLCILRNKYGFQMGNAMEAPPSKTYTLLTFVHNDVDDTDNADDANNYNRVIGIFKCEQSFANTHPNKCTNPPIHLPTHRHPSWVITISSAYGWG